MNWENTIVEIRKNPDFNALVKDAYFDEDLSANVERFRKSFEFVETLKLLRSYKPDAKKLLDIGSGNGIAAVAFALEGYEVLAIEPDPSNTIGAGAIKILKEIYHLQNLEVSEQYAEDLIKQNEEFDFVYVRQALHHAYDLNLFVKSTASLLKRGGILLAVREHVIYNDMDKEWFLSSHPLQKFYGGENAFTLDEYKNSFKQARLDLLKMFGHFENVINYYPLSAQDILKLKNEEISFYKNYLRNKYPIIGKTAFAWTCYKVLKNLSDNDFPSERKIAGRLYSFICEKK
jgi:2-polyprenyl-3-methyl-5-hydroxy-6-metoxy-1,4-benzoquinol methylase